MPELVRIREVKTKLRKRPIELEKRIAHDYKIKGISFKEVMKKHNLTNAQLTSITRQWIVKGTESVKETKEIINKEALIIVNKEDLEFLSFLLHEWQIDFSVPENYTFQETFESKING